MNSGRFRSPAPVKSLTTLKRLGLTRLKISSRLTSLMRLELPNLSEDHGIASMRLPKKHMIWASSRSS